jgi:hypothetical protein
MPPLSYAEIYLDAITRDSLGESSLIIWGGERDVGEYALKDSIPSQIYYEILKEDHP